MSHDPVSVPTGSLDFEIFVDGQREVITLDLITTMLRIESLEAKHHIEPDEYNGEGTFHFANEFAELLEAETSKPMTPTAALYVANVTRAEWIKFSQLLEELDQPDE